MVSCRRGRTLYRLARHIERRRVSGALVDCGVWNGGSTVLMSTGAPSREAWAFDSFEGLPEPSPMDGHESLEWAGECLGSEEKVREAFMRFADPGRLHVVQGWFEETFELSAPLVGRVALLHADGDWYESVALTLATFYEYINAGGYVVIDDYGHWEGAQRATDEFREVNGISAPLVRVDYTGVYWRKSEGTARK
jgi:O-methyltransferase